MFQWREISILSSSQKNIAFHDAEVWLHRSRRGLRKGIQIWSSETCLTTTESSRNCSPRLSLPSRRVSKLPMEIRKLSSRGRSSLSLFCIHEGWLCERFVAGWRMEESFGVVVDVVTVSRFSLPSSEAHIYWVPKRVIDFGNIFVAVVSIETRRTRWWTGWKTLRWWFKNEFEGLQPLPNTFCDEMRNGCWCFDLWTLN